MKELILSKGYKTIIDDEDFAIVGHLKWHARKTKNSVYAVRNVNKTTVQLHRFLLNVPKNKMVDHINRNGLDNRRSNLRICNRSQNLMNSKKPQKGKTSKYKGVYKLIQKSTGHKKLWRASIRLNQKLIFLGDFEFESDAAKAYNIAAQKYFKSFARINQL